MPELLELVDKVDSLLKLGVAAEEKGDKLTLNKAWTEIFSVLMPVF